MRRLAVAAAVLAASVAASGASAAAPAAAPFDNGIAAKPPNEILAAALAAGEHAHSVHIVGSLTSGGVPFGIDCRFAGNDVAGRLVQNGVAFDLVITGGKVYVKGGASFWRSAGGTKDPTVIKLLANRWVASATRKGGPFTKLASSFRLSALLRSLGGSHGKLAVGGTATIHGQPAVALKDTTKGGSLYVATTGQPFPLSIQKAKQAGNDSGRLDFEDWNARMTVKAPASYLDLDKLGKP
jgi:hypothetical protein